MAIFWLGKNGRLEKGESQPLRLADFEVEVGIFLNSSPVHPDSDVILPSLLRDMIFSSEFGPNYDLRC